MDQKASYFVHVIKFAVLIILGLKTQWKFYTYEPLAKIPVTDVIRMSNEIELKIEKLDFELSQLIFKFETINRLI